MEVVSPLCSGDREVGLCVWSWFLFCSGDREVGLCVRRWFLLSVVEIGRWDFVYGAGFSSL